MPFMCPISTSVASAPDSPLAENKQGKNIDLIGLIGLQIALSGTQKTMPPVFGWPRVPVLAGSEANPRLLNASILNYERVSNIYSLRIETDVLVATGSP